MAKPFGCQSPLPSVQPLVSIVTPSYNQAAFISETIDSVLQQDYSPIEYAVYDGGSTDGTVEILKGYGNRLTWISEPDTGQANAINKGWKKARGSILAYLNSDDTYALPNAVTHAVEYFRRHPEVGIVYGGSAYTDSASNQIGTYRAYPFEYDQVFSRCENPIPQPSAFIRREVIDTIGYFDETLQCAIDLDYWLRAGLDYPLAYLPQVLSTFRLHPHSKSVAATAKTATDVLQIYRRLFANPALPASLQQQERKIMARVYELSARQSWQGQAWLAARQSFQSSWKCSPTVPTVKDYIKWAIAVWHTGLFRRG